MNAPARKKFLLYKQTPCNLSGLQGLLVGRRHVREGLFAKYGNIQGHFRDLTFVAADPGRLLSVLRCFQHAIHQNKTTWEVIEHIALVHVEMSPRLSWGGVTGSVSVSYFLDQLASDKRIQAAVKSIFKDENRDLNASDTTVLLHYFVRILKAHEIPLAELSRILDTEINDYNELDAVISTVAERIDREWVLDYLNNARDEWLHRDIGFRKAYLSSLLE